MLLHGSDVIGKRHHGHQNADVELLGKLQQGSKMRPEKLRILAKIADAPASQRGIGFRHESHEGQRLVATDVQEPNTDRPRLGR